MNVKTFLATILLVVVPAMSFAECAIMHETSDQALTCLPGTIWDQAVGKCVESATS